MSDDKPPTEEFEKLYTVQKVAELFSVTSETVRNWIKSGRLSAVKINGYFRVSNSELKKFANSRYGGSAVPTK